MNTPYEIAEKSALAGQAIATFHDRTVRENIDAQIAQANAHVERLKATREKMEKTGLLDLKISDLRQVMNF